MPSIIVYPTSNATCSDTSRINRRDTISTTLNLNNIEDNSSDRSELRHSRRATPDEVTVTLTPSETNPEPFIDYNTLTDTTTTTITSATPTKTKKAKRPKKTSSASSSSIDPNSPFTPSALPTSVGFSSQSLPTASSVSSSSGTDNKSTDDTNPTSSDNSSRPKSLIAIKAVTITAAILVLIGILSFLIRSYLKRQKRQQNIQKFNQINLRNISNPQPIQRNLPQHQSTFSNLSKPLSPVTVSSNLEPFPQRLIPISRPLRPNLLPRKVPISGIKVPERCHSRFPTSRLSRLRHNNRSCESLDSLLSCPSTVASPRRLSAVSN